MLFSLQILTSFSLFYILLASDRSNRFSNENKEIKQKTLNENINKLKNLISLYENYSKTKSRFLKFKEEKDNNTTNDYDNNSNSNPNNLSENIFCTACLKAMSNIQSFVKNYGWWAIEKIGVEICMLTQGLEEKYCSGYGNNYGHPLYNSLSYHYLDSNRVCSTLFVCNSNYETLDADEYAKNVLKDKPINIVSPIPNKNDEEWKVLHVSDTHTDILYEEVLIQYNIYI